MRERFWDIITPKITPFPASNVKMVVVMVGKILGVKMGIFQIENDISVNVIFIRRNIVGCGEHYSFLIPSKKESNGR